MSCCILHVASYIVSKTNGVSQSSWLFMITQPET